MKKSFLLMALLFSLSAPAMAEETTATTTDTPVAAQGEHAKEIHKMRQEKREEMMKARKEKREEVMKERKERREERRAKIKDKIEEKAGEATTEGAAQ